MTIIDRLRELRATIHREWWLNGDGNSYPETKRDDPYSSGLQFAIDAVDKMILEVCS